MISVTELTKKFGPPAGGLIVVDSLNFQAKTGEIIGLLGANGAGKTTTMRLLLGYLTPTAGTIKISDVNPIENRIAVLKNIGYLPENNPLYLEMTVWEYLEFITTIKQADNMDLIIKQVNLSEVIDKKIEALSRGYKQRVGLAAALLGNPKILVLDEPTSGLDPIEQEKIRELIKKTAKDKTIIFSTHILSEVEDVANRLIIIDHGKMVYDGKKPKGKGAVEKLFKKLVKN